MHSKTVALLLADLGVTKTHSRPYVSNDNPYSESQFKTMKYRPGYPGAVWLHPRRPRLGTSLLPLVQPRPPSHALGLMTPATVHHGQAQAVTDQRQQVLQAAYAAHPERFVRGEPKPPSLPTEVWINKPQSS